MLHYIPSEAKCLWDRNTQSVYWSAWCRTFYQ